MNWARAVRWFLVTLAGAAGFALLTTGLVWLGDTFGVWGISSGMAVCIAVLAGVLGGTSER